MSISYVKSKYDWLQSLPPNDLC